MSVNPMIQLYCDVCAENSTLCYESVGHARHMAKANGWKRSKRHGIFIDICPVCQEQLDENDIREVLEEIKP